MSEVEINWWKEKPSGSKVFTEKQQSRFYWSCLSVVMKDATPLTPPSVWAELFFSNVNNIQSMIPEDQKNITIQWCSTGDILHHILTKYPTHKICGLAVDCTHGLCGADWRSSFKSACGRQWCDIYHYHWWTALIKPRLLFSACILCFPRGFLFLSNIDIVLCHV